MDTAYLTFDSLTATCLLSFTHGTGHNRAYLTLDRLITTCVSFLPEHRQG